MKPFTDRCKHVALIFDNHGLYLGKVRLKWEKPTFQFKNRIYNFLPKKSTFFKLVYFTHSVKYYLYNCDNPMPFILNQNPAPVISAVAYKNIIETDFITKLNDLAKPSLLSALFTPRNIIFFLIIVGIAFYFLTGGKLV